MSYIFIGFDAAANKCAMYIGGEFIGNTDSYAEALNLTNELVYGSEDDE